MSTDLLEMLRKGEIYERPPGIRFKETLFANLTAGTGNYLQWPPLYPQYVFEDVYANPIAGAVLSNILGPNQELRLISSNSVFPETKSC